MIMCVPGTPLASTSRSKVQVQLREFRAPHKSARAGTVLVCARTATYLLLI